MRVLPTHCLRGHELSGDNLYLWRGHRHCKACSRERKRRGRLVVPEKYTQLSAFA